MRSCGGVNGGSLLRRLSGLAGKFPPTSCSVPVLVAVPYGGAPVRWLSSQGSDAATSPSPADGSVVARSPEPAAALKTRRGGGGGDSDAPRRGSAGDERRRAPATPGKVHRGVAGAAGATSDIRVRRRDPWGVQQLRDSWSEDAMSKGERENMSERLHREYRYHPDEQRRSYIKITALATVPLIILSWALSYYYHTGRAPWRADPQHLLNLIRAADTSPRSKLYLYKLDENDRLPEHVLRYRAEHAGEREWAERVFRTTHSAFARPTEDDLRRMELEDMDDDDGDEWDEAGVPEEVAVGGSGVGFTKDGSAVLPGDVRGDAAGGGGAVLAA